MPPADRVIAAILALCVLFVLIIPLARWAIPHLRGIL